MTLWNKKVHNLITKGHYWTLYSTSWIQSTPSHHISPPSFLI